MESTTIEMNKTHPLRRSFFSLSFNNSPLTSYLLPLTSHLLPHTSYLTPLTSHH